MSPAAKLADRAVAMLEPGMKLAICTDANAYPSHVLVALAKPEASCVISVPRAEYDGMKLAELAGLWSPDAA